MAVKFGKPGTHKQALDGVFLSILRMLLLYSLLKSYYFSTVCLKLYCVYKSPRDLVKIVCDVTRGSAVLENIPGDINPAGTPGHTLSSKTLIYTIYESNCAFFMMQKMTQHCASWL